MAVEGTLADRFAEAMIRTAQAVSRQDMSLGRERNWRMGCALRRQTLRHRHHLTGQIGLIHAQPNPFPSTCGQSPAGHLDANTVRHRPNSPGNSVRTGQQPA